MLEELPTLSTLDELVDLAEAAGPLFIRYSEGPEEDRCRRSIDYESGLELPGLSVNPLRPEPWWTRPLRHWVARQLCAYAHIGEQGSKVPWVLTGKVIGRGPDNEPLLGPFEPMAFLSESLVEEARTVYEADFDVGGRET
ncbi:MAG TPA: DUF6098 family protein [Acidimicrobiales bacterium]|nr:DUF6098 family protein [Acidimicrobiales bacterium]